MRKLSTFFISISLILPFIMDSFSMVYAQDKTEEMFELEEIVVTAEKRMTDVQKTSIQINAVSGEEITSKAILDVSQVLDGLTGVSTMGGSQGNKIFIRGIGSSLDTNLADPSVSLQKDNVYLGQSEAIGSTLYDVERVEVLYGPQGTLYGKNATGGTVNVITKKPSDKFEASTNLTIGTYDAKNLNAILNIPFSSKIAARIAFDTQRHDAYITDGSGTSNKMATRIRLSYKPTDKISILLTDEWTWDRSKAMNTVPVPGSAGKLPVGAPGTWKVPDVNGDGVADDFLNANLVKVTGGDGIPDIVETGWVIPPLADAWTNDLWHPAPQADYRYQLHSLEVNWDLGWGKMTLIPTLNNNYRRYYGEHMLGISQGEIRYPTTGGMVDTQYTTELRMSNPSDSKIMWTVGAYWNSNFNKNRIETFSDLMDQAESTWLIGSGTAIPAFRVDNPVKQTIKERQSGKALFGQATYPVSDRFRVIGGLRWNNEPSTTKYRVIIYNVTQNGIYGTDPTVAGYVQDFYSKSVAVNDPTAAGGVRHTYDTGLSEYKVTNSPYTYTAGLEFDLAEKSMLYASYKTGFKKGGLNFQTTYPPLPYKPEEVKAYTLGIKNRFLNNQLQLNAEAYYYDYTGYQVQSSATYFDDLTQTWRSGCWFSMQIKALMQDWMSILIG